MELPEPGPDGLTYVTSATAAALLGIAPPTIRSWRAKGYLRPVPGSPSRKSVYLWDDVLEAEHKARQNAIRTSGTNRQVQRTCRPGLP
jgi:predicted site-specific integrase-resolvase